MQVALVILATIAGLALWGWTCAACGRDEARERVTVLERAARMRARSLRALADLVAGR